MNERIWERQLEFNRKFLRDRGEDLDELSSHDRARWTREFVLHITDELHEFLRCTSWKMHRKNDDPVVRSNAREEWVDAFKFLVGLAQIWGFDYDEIVEEFFRKTAVVEYRYRMERRLEAVEPSARVVAVDIDGVLNDYPRHFLRWAARYLQGGAFSGTSELRDEVGPKRYLELKDLYRESGEKRNQGVREGAKALLDGLRSAGFTVVLLSKRPYWRFYRIYADTIEWLERNALFAEAVLFDREKHRRILDRFPELVAIVEDDPRVAAEVAAVGKRVVLVRSELNVGLEGVDGVDDDDVVAGPFEALQRILI